MAYNSSYTGPQVDEGVRKATQIPEIKGEVANYASLPGSATSGDVHLVIAATTGYPAGFYRYSGSAWVFMGREAAAVDSVNAQTGAVVLDADDIDDAATTHKFTTSGDISKLALIEDGADVTSTANVTAAGALMDSEVDADIKTLSLPASTTISTFGASLVDDADAAAGRTTLGVDAAGTDNSTNVTLTGSGTYLSLAGQAITVDPITESDISDLGTYLTAEADTLDTVTGRGATTNNGVTVGSITINGEIVEDVYINSSVTGSLTLDPANGTIQVLTLTGSVTSVQILWQTESL